MLHAQKSPNILGCDHRINREFIDLWMNLPWVGCNDHHKRHHILNQCYPKHGQQTGGGPWHISCWSTNIQQTGTTDQAEQENPLAECSQSQARQAGWPTRPSKSDRKTSQLGMWLSASSPDLDYYYYFFFYE